MMQFFRAIGVISSSSTAPRMLPRGDPAPGRPGQARDRRAAHPGVEIKLSDRGEVLIRTAGLLGYYNETEQTAARS